MTDINLIKCLVAKEHFGYTTYINICSDTEKVIPWGTGDWLGFTALLFIVIAMVILFGFLGYMVKDMMR